MFVLLLIFLSKPQAKLLLLPLLKLLLLLLQKRFYIKKSVLSITVFSLLK